jgi:hypothetical protein
MDDTQVFAFSPDWKSSFQYYYRFASVTAKTGKLEEQRRPITEASSLCSSGTYVVHKLYAQKSFNLLSYLKDRFVAVPVFTEMLSASSIGTDDVYINENLNICYNFRRKEPRYLIITDHKDKTELKTIDQINWSEKYIKFTEEFQYTYALHDTCIYPVVVSTIKAMKKVSETDVLDVWKIDFEGIFSKVSEFALTTTPYPMHDRNIFIAGGLVIAALDLIDPNVDYLEGVAEELTNNTVELLGGELVSIVVEYSIDDNIDALTNNTIELLDGSLQTIVKYYLEGDPDELTNNTVELVGGMAQSIALNYLLWTPEELTNTTVELVGGALTRV